MYCKHLRCTRVYICTLDVTNVIGKIKYSAWEFIRPVSIVKTYCDSSWGALKFYFCSFSNLKVQDDKIWEETRNSVECFKYVGPDRLVPSMDITVTQEARIFQEALGHG